MSLQLILVRHAKSSWRYPALDDHDRPLNGRGRRSATAIGNWLATNDLVPECVLCSDAVRTRETWRFISAEFDSAPQADWLSSLYHATPETVLAVLNSLGSESTVLLLGHNPGLAETAQALAIAAPGHPKFGQYPTAATTVFEADIEHWSAMTWGKGAVRSFIVPRELGTS